MKTQMLNKIKKMLYKTSPNSKISNISWKSLELKNLSYDKFTTPTDAIKINTLKTIEIFNHAEITYYAIPGMDKYRSVFCVAQSDKKRFLKSLFKAKEIPELRIINPKPTLPKKTFDVNLKKSRESLEEASVIRMTWFALRDSDGAISGEEFGAEIEFWDDPKTRNDDRIFQDEWIAPRNNRNSRRVRSSEGISEVSLSAMSRLKPRSLNNFMVPTFESMKKPLISDIHFDIDVVFTWVDSEDIGWKSKRNKFRPTDDVHEEAASDARYLNRNELKYALRSISLYAPWVRKIYIVTDDQTPEWLDTENDRVEIVSHSQIFRNKENLPTFNSHAIETQIHRIPGLSEQFLYLNDDMFFGQPITSDQFFLSNGSAKYFLSQSRVPFFEKSSLDTPVDQAVKNSRTILNRKFGVGQSQVFEHAPYALTRSVLSEIEEENPDEVQVTAANRFRSADDINIPSHLAHHWGYMRGRSVPGRISFSYVGLSHPEVAIRLKRILARRNLDAFCINDTFSTIDEIEAQNLMLADFFEQYFPVHSEWEK